MTRPMIIALPSAHNLPSSVVGEPLTRVLPSRLRLVLIFLLATLFPLSPNASDARPAPNSFADIVEKLSPSVVNVQVKQKVSSSKKQGSLQFEFHAPPGSQLEELFRQFREQQSTPRQRKRRAISQGSGFVVDSRGIIVTNSHVINNAESIAVVLQDGTRLDASVVGNDTSTDLAVLRVKSAKSLPTVSWGDSDKTRVGDWVIAIGNPLGFGGSVTAGIVSARGRNIRAGPYDDFIQTDAPINRGNSGGPLFDLSGKVIGINTAIVSPNGGSIGIGFAIPSKLARTIVDQIGKYGEARRGWMGIAFQPLTPEIAESVGLKGGRSYSDGGIIVSSVVARSPASKAGLQSGDVITSFNRKKISRDNRLPLMVAETPIGTSVPIEIWRNGKRKVLSLTVARLTQKRSARLSGGSGSATPESKTKDDNNATKVTKLPSIGVGVIPLNAKIRAQNKVPKSVDGLLIVDNNSNAAEKGLQRGSIIREINGKKVTSGVNAKNLIASARKDGKKAVLVKLSDLQGKRETFIGIALKVS